MRPVEDSRIIMFYAFRDFLGARGQDLELSRLRLAVRSVCLPACLSVLLFVLPVCEAKSGHEVSLLSSPELKLAGNSSACVEEALTRILRFCFLCG